MSLRGFAGFPGRLAAVVIVTYGCVAIGRCPARSEVDGAAHGNVLLGRMLLVFLMLVAVPTGASRDRSGSGTHDRDPGSNPLPLAGLIS